MNSHFLLATILVVVSSFSAYAQGRSRRAEPQDKTENQTLDVIKVDANLVSVPVIVSDRMGRYIPNLRVENFKLFDNGAEQKITYFDAADEPLNVALLLDTSRSTHGALDDIKDAARNFLKHLRHQDRAMIVSFDVGINHLSRCDRWQSNHSRDTPCRAGDIGLTSDRRVLENAINSATVGPAIGTTLNDAVMQVAGRDLKSVTGRKAIILLSDGQDFGSEISAKTLLEAEAESDAMVYSIFYESDFRGGLGSWGVRFPGGVFGRGRGRARLPEGSRRRNPEGNEKGAEFLQKLSEVTSGRFYRSELTNLSQTFALIADELRHQYRLGFYPGEIEKDGSVHQLTVKVDQKDVAVRARKQYRAEKR